MTRIMAYHVSEEEAEIIDVWTQQTGVIVERTPLNLDEQTVGLAEGFDGITTGQVGKIPNAVYSKLKAYGIPIIAQRSAGFEMYDTAVAKAEGVIITNVPSYSPESIAEFTVQAMMRILRKTDQIDQRVRQQDFTWDPVIRSRPLKNLTIAVIGVGRIGSRVARILSQGYGARVVGFDIAPQQDTYPFIDFQSNLTSAITQADIVTLHMPLTADNYHQFNNQVFEQMKQGAIFINAARGGIVDTEDLLAVLDAGHLQGAALDVYESEAPYMPKDWSGRTIEDPVFERLLNHPCVHYTPHIAYYTDEAVKNLVEGALDSILEVIDTGAATHCVNP